MLDVSDASSIEGLGDLLESVDILVNNAGVVREGPALARRRPIGTRSWTPI